MRGRRIGFAVGVERELFKLRVLISTADHAAVDICSQLDLW